MQQCNLRSYQRCKSALILSRSRSEFRKQTQLYKFGRFYTFASHFFKAIFDLMSNILIFNVFGDFLLSLDGSS
jgi:hypothetical protein